MTSAQGASKAILVLVLSVQTSKPLLFSSVFAAGHLLRNTPNEQCIRLESNATLAETMAYTALPAIERQQEIAENFTR